jgi:hypothetical protein
MRGSVIICADTSKISSALIKTSFNVHAAPWQPKSNWPIFYFRIGFSMDVVKEGLDDPVRGTEILVTHTYTRRAK